MMFVELSAVLLAGGAVLIAILAVAYRQWRRREADKAAASVPRASSRPAQAQESEARAPASYCSAATAAAAGLCFKAAFGTNRIDYDVTGEHAQVLSEVSRGVATSVHHQDYFPRRPMLLPKLLQAINDTESTRQQLVGLIREDPAIAGAVLQRANSAFYRVSPVVIERLDRAVVMLGAAGLRGLMATAIMQPVFRLPKGYFECFGDVTWEHARRSSQAAEACAHADRTTDPFVAQLLGLLGSLASIVLFRLTMEKYREQPRLLPRAEVFIKAIQKHRAELACLIARSWELSDISLQAADEQLHLVAPQKMSPLGKAIYYGELCGALALLHARGHYVPEAALRLLAEQGLQPDIAQAAWRAAIAESRN